ncbi:MAG: ParB/RepB/Spo0J family partition protein [Acidobacteria bacterium]|nr:ParB/RepB/Spo0J family partition protein [Acidobacteriota bacterium]
MNTNRKKDDAEKRVELAPPSADAWVSPDSIERNPANPRLIFHQKQLDDLKKSIFEVGILQPLTVYERNDAKGRYVLIDGERRWRSARELNLQTLPVHILKEPTPVQNLTMMFNIHKLRVDWELMPTAISLKALMELSGETRQKELSKITGMSPSMVRKALSLLSFPEKHRKLVLEHKIKDNLLLEIYDVLRALDKHLPELVGKRGKEKLIDAIVAKEKAGHIKTVTELRDLRKVVDSISRGAPKDDVVRVVNRVLDESAFTIDRAYSKVRSLYDIAHLTNQFRRLADELNGFSPDGVDDELLRDFAKATRDLATAIDRIEKSLDSSSLRSKI